MSLAHARNAPHEGHRCNEERPLWMRVVTLDAVVIRRVILGLFSLALLLPLVPGYPGIVCPLRAVTGVPCPFCGTTGAVREASQLDFGASLRTNPAPLIAVVVAVVLFALRPSRMRVPVAILLALPAGMWIVQLMRFSIIDI